MFKKIVLVLIPITLIGSTFFAYGYSDSQLKSANNLAKRETIKDHRENPEEYNLDENVLRQEIALVSRRVSGFRENKKCKNTFGDISGTMPNDWACKNVEALVDNDLITANENFRPEDSITKSEALIMFIRSIGFDFRIENMDKWQEEVVDFAVEKGVVKDFSDYNALALRGWIFEIADYSIQIKEKEIKQKVWKGRELKIYTDEAL